jgi:chromosome segregation ATPase
MNTIRTLVETRAGRVTINEDAEGVTVTVASDSAPSTRLPSRNLYTDEEVAAAQTSEAKLVSEPLLVRIRELEKDRDRNREATSLALNERDRLARETIELRQKADMFKAQAYSENERAAQNKAWAERAEKNGADLSAALVTAEKALGESRELVKFKDKVADEIEEEAERLRGKVRELRDSVAARDRLLTEASHRTKDMSNRLAEVEETNEWLGDRLGKVAGAVQSPQILAVLRTDWKSWTEEEAATLTNALRATRDIIGAQRLGTSQA